MSQYLGAVHVEFSDDDLVLLFRQGELEALELLFERYRRFTRAKARAYFLVGADRDDIEQEGLIGLFKAVRDYRPERESSFRAFAELCVTRQIMSAIKSATRHKHQPLNQYVSLSGLRTGDGAEEWVVDDLFDDHRVPDPADVVVSDERMDEMRTCISELLSELEIDVLTLYLEGRSYHDIGEVLERHPKSIDNALQRVKRKVEIHLVEQQVAEAAPAVA